MTQQTGIVSPRSQKSLYGDQTLAHDQEGPKMDPGGRGMFRFSFYKDHGKPQLMMFSFRILDFTEVQNNLYSIESTLAILHFDLSLFLAIQSTL